MSVEPLVLAALVEEGSPRPAYMCGLSRQDFEIYRDEFVWIEWSHERRKPINKRIFKEKFPNFEYVVSRDDLGDLLHQLKDERAYSRIIQLMDTVNEKLEPENAVELADYMRDILTEVVKIHAPHSDVSMKDWSNHYELTKENQLILKSGGSIGMPTGIPSLDFHWDGFLPGRLIGVLGRPGHSKSYYVAWIAWQAIKNGYRVGLFSPEMNQQEHMYRVHTLASYDSDIQKAVGLTGPFKNRDLMRGLVDLKRYKLFLEYFESLPGDCRLFTNKYRAKPMTIAYVQARAEDLGLHGVMADPLSKLHSSRQRDNAVQEDYDRVGGFQELGESLNIFTVATNWANRGIADRPPSLNDSFGSDALAKESDHIISVFYDEEERELTLRCSKSRFGKGNFMVSIDFVPNTGKFQEKDIPESVVKGLAELKKGKAIKEDD